MRHKTIRFSMFFACTCTCMTAFAMLQMLSSPAWAQIPRLPVYSEALASGWQNWSWGGMDVNFSNKAPVHAGKNSIAITFKEGWCGFMLGYPGAIDVSGFDTMRFWVHGGSGGGQQIEFVARNSCTSVSKVITLKAGTWMVVDLPLRDMGNPRAIDNIYWFNRTPGPQATFYLDDIAFIQKGTPPPAAKAGPVLSVNARAARHAISPDIYGMNFASEDLAAELGLPVNRRGGNATTRYNWQNDTSNRASDWYYENIAEENDPTNLPDGSAADLFIEQNRRTGTDTLLTVPLIGWTPKDRSRSCGYSVNKYGPQQSTDPWNPDCGNGIRPDGTKITGNDPLDTSIEITPAFVQEWIAYLMNRYGSAAQGGVKFYNLDNEPMLWYSTHRDVHPNPTSYDEIRDLTYAYASAIKETDPGAKTCGPVVWGWTAYFWSALDWESGMWDWWNHPQDRLAHGNVPFIEWYLQQMRVYEQAHGKRILDYLDVHYYPQEDGVYSGSTGSQATQDLRLRSTRSLWDLTYTDESWIGDKIYLIPRMKQWVANNYPGTRLCMSEYSWGAMCHVNGALAEADVLGIFGREGLDMATLWGPPSYNEPGAFAFRMYLNYDGAGGKFGDISVKAASANQDNVSIYAAQRKSDKALTLMVVNKTRNPRKSVVKLAGFVPSGPAKVYVYGLDDASGIVPKPDQAVTNTGFTATFPDSSITLIVIPGHRG